MVVKPDGPAEANSIQILCQNKVHPGYEPSDTVRFNVRTVLEGAIRIYVSSRMGERRNLRRKNRALSKPAKV